MLESFQNIPFHQVLNNLLAESVVSVYFGMAEYFSQRLVQNLAQLVHLCHEITFNKQFISLVLVLSLNAIAKRSLLITPFISFIEKLFNAIG